MKFEGSAEKNNSPEFTESERQFGRQYVAVLESAVSGKPVEQGEVDALDPTIKILLEASNHFRQKQLEYLKEADVSAQALLTSVFRTQDQQDLLSDTTKYHLRELSPGYLAVLVDIEVLWKLMPGAQAVAVLRRDGPSFMLVQNSRKPEVQERLEKENLPHESHHLIWKTAVMEGHFKGAEEDEHMVASFRTFKEELIARAATDGGLGGYHHLEHLRPEEREALEQEHPGKAEKIINRISELNGSLHDLTVLCVQRVGVDKADMLHSFFSAQNFAEMEAAITRAQKIVSRLPEKPAPPAQDGWLSVPT